MLSTVLETSLLALALLLPVLLLLVSCLEAARQVPEECPRHSDLFWAALAQALDLPVAAWVEPKPVSPFLSKLQRNLLEAEEALASTLL